MQRKKDGEERQEMTLYGLMEKLGCGMVEGMPVEVEGGLLHKMYRVAASGGIFAVKRLNPEVMKRQSALPNMISAEKIAAAFSSALPAVCALERNGTRIHKLGDDYYIVYPWVDGESVFSESIKPGHCSTIGEALGRMHRSNLKVEGVVPEEDSFAYFPWDRYAQIVRSGAEGSVQESGQEGSGWRRIYLDALEDVKRWNEEACSAGQVLSEQMVISHRDLDPKNVMWKKGESVVCAGIIDWEAAGYVNPFQEFMNAVNDWTDNGRGELVPEKLEALACAYGRYMDMGDVEWSQAVKGSRMGMLGWLEYNVKRALGLEAADEAEVRLGERQAAATIWNLYFCRKKLDRASEILQNHVVCTAGENGKKNFYN